MERIGARTGIDTAICYLRYGPLVLRRCRQLLGDEERARDAMHDTFVKLLRHRDRLDDASPGGLLYRIATNVCLNHLRAARRRPEVLEESLDDRLAEGADPETMAGVRRLLSWLFAGEHESTAQMAVLHFQDGRSVGEVAATVGLSTSAVRRRLAKLRARCDAGCGYGQASRAGQASLTRWTQATC
jgi:RNA polymerase sigma factor (sigma-70 family)